MRSFRHHSLKSILGLILFASFVILPAREARADASGTAMSAAYISGLALLGTVYFGGNGAFTIHDVTIAGDRNAPHAG